MPGTPARASRVPRKGVIGRGRSKCLEPTCQNQDDQNQQDEAQSSARAITPAPAVWPGRDRSQEHQNKDDKQNGDHGSPPEWPWQTYPADSSRSSAELSVQNRTPRSDVTCYTGGESLGGMWKADSSSSSTPGRQLGPSHLGQAARRLLAQGAGSSRSTKGGKRHDGSAISSTRSRSRRIRSDAGDAVALRARCDVLRPGAQRTTRLR
jgi:hypothetical protein